MLPIRQPSLLSTHPTCNLRVHPTGLGHRLSALAGGVVLACAALTSFDARALTLGRLAMQSALGEPLRAEIDLTQVTPAEVASLTVNIAPAATFRAAGLEFNPGLAGVSVSVQRRADGRAFVQVTGTRAVNEPYLDLILEASWSSGRIVRDYTLLFDPPKTKTATPVPSEPVAAAVALPPAQPAPLAAAPAAPAPVPQPPPAVATPTRPPAPAAKTPTPPPTPGPTGTGSTTLTVRPGDTAGRIAGANKPPSVTLEQMLVAMLRSNPQAFINGNINRIKAGAIIDLPDAHTAGQVEAAEAKQTIVAQSGDFDNFRRRLAASAPPTTAPDAQRQATGKVQSDITDKKSAAPAADQLKLSKATGTQETNATAEDQIARERQAKATTERAAELARNIADLAKLGAGAAPPPAIPASAPVPAPAPAAPAVAAAPAEPPPPAAAEPAPAAQPSAPVEPPAAPVATEAPAPNEAKPDAPAAPVVETATPEAAVEEGGLLAEITENPMVLPAAGGLLALLAGFGALRWRQRKRHTAADSSYLESRLQPDSFFGASGGQNVDTAEAAPSGSSMMYSPSQLDAGGDVDPVAEADVYLAYGRDLQAEEILKEAMRLNPSRVAIHSKMLEIYAKRRDAKSFEVLACEVYALTQGSGPEWEHACQLGQELDPANPLYQPGGSPPLTDGATQLDADASPGMANTQPFDPAPTAGATLGGNDGALDLDLDFSLDDMAPPTADTFAPVDNALSFDVGGSPSPDMGAAATPPPSFELDASDLAFDTPSDLPSTKFDSLPAAESPAEANGKDAFELSFAPEPSPTESTQRIELPAASTAAAPDDGMLSFDLGDLSLDLGNSSDPQNGGLDDIPEGDPLETKLSLAAEFLAIGDTEGARALAEEVVSEASGGLQAKARTFLADLG